MRGRDTKNIILDAAESLFSKRSYIDVTFRQIADLAGLHVSQIIYHFQNKDRLLKQVVIRRAAELNDERMDILNTYRRLVGDDNMEIEPLVRAFIDPYLTRLIEDKTNSWRNFGALIGRIAWNPLTIPAIGTAYNETAKHYLMAFTKAAPEIDEEHIHRAFQFLLAAMYSACADNRRIDTLSDGQFSSWDIDRIYTSVIPFVTGGFKELAKLPNNAPNRSGAK